MRQSRDIIESNPYLNDDFLSEIVKSSFERLSETQVFDIFCEPE